MALVFSEGFDAKSSNADLNIAPFTYQSGSTTVSVTSSAGVFGGKALTTRGSDGLSGSFSYVDATFTGYARTTNGTNSIRASFWYRTNVKNNAASQTNICALLDSGGIGAYLTLLHSTNCVRVLRWNDNATLATGSIPIYDDNWHHIEWEFVPNASTGGVCKLWVDGVLDINITGSATASAITSTNTFAKFRMLTSPGNNSAFGDSLTGSFGQIRTDFDDIIIYDDQGSAMNTAPLGPRRIYTVFPASDNTVAYTRDSGANNYARVNDTALNRDTSYVDGTSVGNADLYGLTSVSGWNPGTINAVSAKMWSAAPNGGRTARQNIKLSATTSNGATVTPGANYSFQSDFFYAKPGGGSWAVGDLSSLLLGVEVVT